MTAFFCGFADGRVKNPPLQYFMSLRGRRPWQSSNDSITPRRGRAMPGPRSTPVCHPERAAERNGFSNFHDCRGQSYLDLGASPESKDPHSPGAENGFFGYTACGGSAQNARVFLRLTPTGGHEKLAKKFDFCESFPLQTGKLVIRYAGWLWPEHIYTRCSVLGESCIQYTTHPLLGSRETF